MHERPDLLTPCNLSNAVILTGALHRVCALPRLLAGGTLIEAIANAGGKLPERQAAVKVALPLLTALHALHSAGIMHRHIRPEHLLIMQGCLKLGDLSSGACFDAVAAVAASNAAAKAAAAAAKLALLTGSGGAEAFAAAFAAAPAVIVDVRDVAVDIQSSGMHIPAGGAENGGKGGEEQEEESRVPEDACNFRIGSIEYMAPEMLSKPTSSEVFHLVSGIWRWSGLWPME